MHKPVTSTFIITIKYHALYKGCHHQDYVIRICLIQLEKSVFSLSWGITQPRCECGGEGHGAVMTSGTRGRLASRKKPGLSVKQTLAVNSSNSLDELESGFFPIWRLQTGVCAKDPDTPRPDF